MTLISYIHNRYTIRKTSDMYSKQKKKEDFQDPEAQFYSKNSPNSEVYYLPRILARAVILQNSHINIIQLALLFR